MSSLGPCLVVLGANMVFCKSKSREVFRAAKQALSVFQRVENARLTFAELLQAINHPKHGAQPSLLDGLFPLESTSNKEGHACQAWPWPRNHGLGARVFPLLASLAGARPSLSTCCEINPVEKGRGVSHHGLTHTSVPHQDSESSHL
jgi:hypothetical protein